MIQPVSVIFSIHYFSYIFMVMWLDDSVNVSCVLCALDFVRESVLSWEWFERCVLHVRFAVFAGHLTGLNIAFGRTKTVFDFLYSSTHPTHVVLYMTHWNTVYSQNSTSKTWSNIGIFPRRLGFIKLIESLSFTNQIRTNERFRIFDIKSKG